MIRPIMTNEFFLSQPSEPATAHDVEVGKNLVDTLSAHAHECVGMAANMIGVRKRAIVFADGAAKRVMFNPEIVEASGEYEAMEGCLSLEGQRKAKRYKRITVSYCDDSFTVHRETFKGFTAQIIQHEIDHCNGVLI